MNKAVATAALILLFAACQKAPDRTAPTENAAPANLSTAAPQPTNEGSEAAAPAPPEPGTPGGLPDDRTPLPEPKGPIDPKSAEGAGQVVQHYGALIEEKRFGEAEALWGDAAAAKRQTAELKRYSQAHLQIGKPGDMEGAAGSIYITVPIVLYGTREGKNVHRGGDMILRRVNDVPGSTEAQRRWHIERVAWSAA